MNPESAGFDSLAVVVLHFHRRVIGLNDLRFEHALQHRLHDRGEQAGGGRHPVAHRGARQFHTEPLKNAFLTIKWQVIRIFTDGDVRHQSRAGKSLLDRLGKPLGDDDVSLARLASILGTHVLEHDQRRRHIFKLFTHFLADAGARRAAVGARPLLVGDVMHDPPARQARRQRLAAVAWDRSFHRRGRGFRRNFLWNLGSARRQNFAREEQELIGIKRFGFLAVKLAEKLFELMLQLVVEVSLLAQGREQCANEPVGGFNVVGKWGVGVDRRHTIDTDDARRCDRESSREHAKWMSVSGGSRRGQRVARQPAGAAQIDTLQDGEHLRRRHLDAAAFGLGEAKRAFF